MKNIAVIGAGYWGKNLVRNYHNLGVLKSVCDSNSTILSTMKENYEDINIQTNYDAILSDQEIQGVVIGLPAEYHYTYAKQALLKNKDVYVEKPLSLTLEHAQELNHLAHEKNKILMVGHLLRYHTAFIKLKEVIDSGEIGRIQYIYSNRLSFGKIRREENILWSFAPHDISMVLALCNEEPDTVIAVGHNYLHQELADVTTTHLSFPSGINCHIFVSWLHPFKEQKLVVVGNEKMIVFEDTQSWDKKIALYSHHIRWQNGMPIPEKAEAEYIAVEQSEPLLAECKHFTECIEQRKTPLTDGQEGFRVLKVLDLAQKSLEKKNLDNNSVSVLHEKKPFFVHTSAFVDEGCEIGKNTKIWHFSHVQKNAKIGKKCILGQNVNIANDVIIGNNVKIQNNVSVYTGTTVEDDVFLGPSCVLTNVLNPRSQVNRHSLYEKTLIKKGATVGANATIVCGVTLGRYAFIGAGAVVTKEVPDYAMILGVPGKQMGWMSRHGVQLPEPGTQGIMVCPESGLRYKEEKPGIVKCLDLNEELPLPENLTVGVKSYTEFKKNSKSDEMETVK